MRTPAPKPRRSRVAGARARTAPERTAPEQARPKRNPDGTKKRILRAAVREFALEGYSGARVETICKRARANPRMIYHYFGDKDQLYVTVLEHVLSELRREELKLEVDHVAPLAGMLELFHFIHDHFGAHPELIPLLSGENLQRARFLRRSVKAPIVASPLIELLRRLLERGVKEGVFRAGIDPLQLYVMMVALSYFHRSNAHTLSVLFRTDLLDSGWQNEQKRNAELMLTRFLERQSARAAE
jgi:AcrR family transcriptional regulator